MIASNSPVNNTYGFKSQEFDEVVQMIEVKILMRSMEGDAG